MLLNCVICGKQFKRTPCRISRAKVPCCSQSCAYTARRKSLADRLWSRTKKTESCWLWMGSPDKFGYGKLVVRKGIEKGAHRISWELAHGPIPDGLLVLHKCDVPNCVNPDHLFLGTYKDNKADCISKGRHSHGSNHWKTHLKEDDIRLIRRLYREGIALQQELANRFRVPQTQISRIVRGTSWTHVV